MLGEGAASDRSSTRQDDTTHAPRKHGTGRHVRVTKGPSGLSGLANSGAVRELPHDGRHGHGLPFRKDDLSSRQHPAWLHIRLYSLHILASGHSTQSCPMTFKLLPDGRVQCIVLKKGSGVGLFSRPKWQTRTVTVDPSRRLLEYSEHAGSAVKGSVDLRNATITLPPDGQSACTSCYLDPWHPPPSRTCSTMPLVIWGRADGLPLCMGGWVALGFVAFGLAQHVAQSALAPRFCATCLTAASHA